MQIRVTRTKDGKLWVYADDDASLLPVGRFKGSDEVLHSLLCTAGYKRMLKYGADEIAGLYLRGAVMA